MLWVCMHASHAWWTLKAWSMSHVKGEHDPYERGLSHLQGEPKVNKRGPLKVAQFSLSLSSWKVPTLSPPPTSPKCGQRKSTRCHLFPSHLMHGELAKGFKISFPPHKLPLVYERLTSYDKGSHPSYNFLHPPLQKLTHSWKLMCTVEATSFPFSTSF